MSPTVDTVQTHSETRILSAAMGRALKMRMPFALWRLPNEHTTWLLLSNNYRPLKTEEAIEDLPEGFVFAPFDPAKEPLLLPCEYLFAFENGKLSESREPAMSRAASWMKETVRGEAEPGSPQLTKGEILVEESTGYIDLVRRSMEAIAHGEMEKVVPSRTKYLALNGGFDIVSTFQKLRDKYPQALVSFVSIPEVGNWLGATPEMLISVEGGTTFRTVALAGTLPYRDGMDLKSVAWTQKEIEEQALVERYIISCFKKIRLREYEEYGPRTVVAGNLVHLKSDFSVDLKSTRFPQLGSVMLRLLHPTSAVCGQPLGKALDFLKANEGHDREFYSGYLGPVNIKNDIHLFVNLRCMKLTGDHALLFAGAGVTSDSDPMMEFRETEMKFETLLNVIF